VVIVGAVLGTIVLLLLLAIIGHRYHAHQISLRATNFVLILEAMKEAGELAEGQAAAQRVPREIKRSSITMTANIGAGAFGEVWKAVLDESSAGGVPGYSIAIKTSKENTGEGADEMIREAAVMAQVPSHRNVVSIIGVVTSGSPLLLLISLCENGSLLSYLKKTATTAEDGGGMPLSSTVRYRMVTDTAAGMAHLTSCRFIHRDLAARNVMVDTELICKVGDFGLSRAGGSSAASGEEGDGIAAEDYYRSSNGVFPIRWTAPEAMESMRFSQATDVWSFGIVVLEIYLDGARPYLGMKNAEVIQKVLAGYRAPKPVPMPDALYPLLLSCWAEDAGARPVFSKLVEVLGTGEIEYTQVCAPT